MRILLTGATGQLGRRIAACGLFQPLLVPTRRELDLNQASCVEKYVNSQRFDAVIHTAAIARMKLAHRNPMNALQTNLMGTCRLVEQIRRAEQKRRKKIRFIYISTDGVYPSILGPYKETDATIPYNSYGWTKLGAECAVHLLANFCIIRTRFFDPDHTPFKTHAIDAYNSALPINDLVQAIYELLHSDFTGTINVGGLRCSDYQRYKKFDPQATPCRFEDIQKKIPFMISKDASMDCGLWEGLKQQ